MQRHITRTDVQQTDLCILAGSRLGEGSEVTSKDVLVEVGLHRAHFDAVARDVAR